MDRLRLIIASLEKAIEREERDLEQNIDCDYLRGFANGALVADRHTLAALQDLMSRPC